VVTCEASRGGWRPNGAAPPGAQGRPPVEVFFGPSTWRGCSGDRTRRADVNTSAKRASASMRLLDSSTSCGHHQLNEFFGDARLETFGVSFVHSHHVSDYAPVAAVGIDEHFGVAGARQAAP
jgi:hypothetical protein